MKGASPEAGFGQVLRELRTGAGLSQEDLGFESGLDRTYISMLERGLRQPTLTTLFTLAQALQMRASEIVRRVEDQAND